MDTKEKIERLRIKADLLCREKSESFVRDIDDTYYFCYIIFVGEDKLYIQNFKGKRFDAGIIKEDLDWADVIRVDKYQEKII